MAYSVQLTDTRTHLTLSRAIPTLDLDELGKIDLDYIMEDEDLGWEDMPERLDITADELEDLSIIQGEGGMRIAGMITHDGIVIGHVTIVIWPDSVEIERIDVDESWQGQGVGTAAIRAIREATRRLYVPTLITADNPAADRLYHRLGEEETKLEIHRAGYPIIRIS